MKRNTATRDRDRAYYRRLKANCGICGKPINYELPHLDPGEYVLDHITPLAAGGTDTRNNKQPAHRICNAKKGAKPHAPIVRRSGTLN